MESIKEQIATFLAGSGVPAVRQHTAALLFAKSMQQELKDALAEWNVEIELMEQFDRNQTTERVRSN